MATWRYEISLLVLEKYFTSECTQREIPYLCTVMYKISSISLAQPMVEKTTRKVKQLIHVSRCCSKATLMI